MKRWGFLLIGLCVTLVTVAVSGVGAVEEPMLAPQAATQWVAGAELVFPFELTASFLRETSACDANASPLFGALRYECPFGAPYCRKAQDCGNYCGGGFEVCEFGCCTCAG